MSYMYVQLLHMKSRVTSHGLFKRKERAHHFVGTDSHHRTVWNELNCTDIHACLYHKVTLSIVIAIGIIFSLIHCCYKVSML